MDRLLARLERTFLGKIAIERLTTYIVGGMVMAYVLGTVRPEFIAHLVLVPQLVPIQPWRLVTFLFIPPNMNMFWLFFAFYFTWLIGTNLEAEWGTLKFNLFYFVGAIGTAVAAFVTGMPQGNYFLNLSLFLAFATIFPDYEIRLFFFIPIKVKWLALLDAGYLTLLFIQGGIGTRAAIIAALANYFLFFAGHLVALLKGRRLLVRQAARRAEQRPEVRDVDGRSCAICGVKQADGADIRVCSCEKCGKPRDLCLEHARNH